MPVNSQIQTLSQLLANNNEYFQVPAYQRRYSWKIKQVNALFQDINSLSAIKQNNDLHLLGMIIVHKPMNATNGVIEVVDGQQRLTTITILLKELSSNINSI